MAAVHISQNASYLDNVHVEKLLPPACGDSGGEIEVSEILSTPPYATDEFGEPEILPRIGGEYQAELPHFDYISHTKKPNADSPKNFVVGMPMLLTWVSTLKPDIPGSCGSSTSSDSAQNVIKNEISSSVMLSLDSMKPKEVCQKSHGPGHIMVPGLDDEHWSAIQKDSFLLGLYIFEKNFLEVKQFVGAKEMGSLLSFYYGKFYGSQEYQKWSQCRKMKSKKCIYGQRIFTGLRQQELLSRILPKVSEECRNTLLEVSKTFVEEKMSLSDYVSSLKAMVGMATLVEAIGIGTGKQDLTGMALESSKSNQTIPVRPEIPTGKAWSSLSPTEIVKFLSGNYRLSKARSNDLFWEAAWPRLLARGWHSEQPHSKQCLVFLIPGIKKFSSKLVKGDHYFDSITDILSEVAREPELIELDSEGDQGNKNSDEDDNDHLPTKQRPCYLQPKTPNRSGAVLKFTVVDTSLSVGKVRELRTLPSEFSDTFVAWDCTEGSDRETSGDTSNLSDAVTDNLILKTAKSDKKLVPSKSGRDLKNKRALKVSNQSRKATKSQSSQKRKQANADRVPVPVPIPIAKQQQILSPCNHKETSTGLENEMPPSCCTSIHDVTENLSSQVGSCLDKLSSTSSSRGSPGESIENPQSQTLIDLNLPHISTDTENQEKDSVKVDDPSSLKSSTNEVRSEQPQPNLNTLRHSTRNRPPTSRVLEALADGYLTINRKRKGKDVNSQDAASRPSQRACLTVQCNESTNSSVESRVEEADNGALNSSNCNTFGRSEVPASQANEASVSARCGLSN